MSQDQVLRDEIESLKAEVARLRQEAGRRKRRPATSISGRGNEEHEPDPPVKKDRAPTGTPDAAEASPASAGRTDASSAAADGDTLTELAQQLHEMLDSAEEEIVAHPLAAVRGAFALGLVVGAVLRR